MRLRLNIVSIGSSIRDLARGVNSQTMSQTTSAAAQTLSDQPTSMVGDDAMENEVRPDMGSGRGDSFLGQRHVGEHCDCRIADVCVTGNPANL